MPSPIKFYHMMGSDIKLYIVKPLIAVKRLFRAIQLVVVSLVLVFVTQFRQWRSWRIHVDGFVAEGFELVAQAFRENVESQQEQGASFAVYHKGELVVNLWGGYADHHALRLRKEDSTSMAYSCTKFVSAVCLELLADRGLLDYKRRVCEIWPEFAENGKEDITFEQLFSHQAGLVTIRDVHKLSLQRDDPEKLCKLLAKQRPHWKPGSAHGYHMLTFGLYADQVVRRLDPQRRSLAEFFREEIAIPFDIDFSIGESRDQFHRACRETMAFFGIKHIIVRMLPVGVRFLYESIKCVLKYRIVYLMHFFGNPTDWKPRRLNNPEFRDIPCGSSHGFGTAKGFAKLMGILANGGTHEGLRLLSEKAIEHLSTPLAIGYDRVIMRQVNYGPGAIVNEVIDDNKQVHKAIGHWGAGGQIVLFDREAEAGWAYLTNFANIIHGFAKDHRYEKLERALYNCLNNIGKIK